MKQLNLKTGRTYDIDGYVDAKGIKYIGSAWELMDGTWLCLANVGGALCRVQVKISFHT